MLSPSIDEVPRRTILSFATVVGGALLLLALHQGWRGAPRWVWLALAGIAAILLLGALIAPRLLHPVYRAWMRLGEALGWLNTRILLSLVFFLVVTPIGLVLRLFGRSPLDTRPRESYWTDVEPHSYGDRHVEKQF